MASVRPALAIALLSAAACAGSTYSSGRSSPSPKASEPVYYIDGVPVGTAAAPSPDPRVGLRAGSMDAAEAAWNLRVLSKTPPSGKFLGSTNSDLAFTGQYVIQGNYNGYQVWDISNPRQPVLKFGNYCPASQSDVSVYKNLLFVSAEGNTGRIDCGDQGVKNATPLTVEGSVPTQTTPTETGPKLPKGNPAAGKTIFTSVAGCSGCHTLKAAGSSGTIGPNLDNAKPDLARIVMRVENGKGAMPPFKDRLKPQQIADVAAFVYTSTH